MISIISFVLCLIIIGILYRNMIAWEGDYRIAAGVSWTFICADFIYFRFNNWVVLQVGNRVCSFRGTGITCQFQPCAFLSGYE